jgi:hypothetical protein
MTAPADVLPPLELPVDPDAIVAAVRSCPTVADVSGGIAGEAATYLPGRRVTGVQVGGGDVTVHVVARYGPTVAEVAAEVRAALAPLVGSLAVNVVIEDLTDLPAWS